MLNKTYKEEVLREKKKFYKNMVNDLKISNPRKWYSKLNRLSGKTNKNEVEVEEFEDVEIKEQAERLLKYYSSTRNEYSPVNREHFSNFLNTENLDPSNIFIDPSKIPEVIRKMNINSATVPGDIPLKLLNIFSTEISLPLTHIINSIFEQQSFPSLWKREYITPIPKSTVPVPTVKQLRPISGLLNCAWIMDRILAEYMLADMAATRDNSSMGMRRVCL